MFVKRSCLHVSVDINECQPGPCENSISCIDGVNSYKCVCKPGYTGKNCGVGKDQNHEV